MLLFREFASDTLKNKVFSLLILLISYITPLIGIVIAYTQNKNKKTSLFKHFAILGISVAMMQFIIEFIIFAIKNGAVL